jgi:hypothetical protein
MNKVTQNYKLYCTVDNFESPDKELDFGDFKIIAIEQGSRAAIWRKKLHCKGVPKYRLEKSFLNYVIENGDISGVDNIMNSMDDLLIAFRLFKSGDIGFGNFLFEDADDTQRTLVSLSNPINLSFPKYSFANSEIKRFNEFKTKITGSQGYRNKFFRFALSYFTRGIERGVFHNQKIGAERLIDYFTALESLFLIDGEKYFLRRTIAKRIANFLSDSNLEKKIKTMYDGRSKIVHGGHIEENGGVDIKQAEREEFEQIMRNVFVKLLDYDFSSKDDIVKFMKGLFNIPEKALDLMRSAHAEAEKLLIN